MKSAGYVVAIVVDPRFGDHVGILDTVAGHHDRYSHSPGYSGLEIYGAEPSPTLLAALAEYRLADIAAFPGGFRASTSDGHPAGSPNDS